MNWKQRYASATPQEREDILFLMLQKIEARKNRNIISRGRIIKERRGPFAGAHFLNDRRRRLIPRPLFLTSFMAILTAVSLAIWISFFYLPPAYAAPLMLFHLASLSAILIIKPYKRLTAAK